MMISNRIIGINDKYVINGRILYGDKSESDIRNEIEVSLGLRTRPVAQFMSCLTDLVRDAEGDTDIILRRNANDDNVLLVDALDQFGDQIFRKSPAGREAPLIQRYPYGIYEKGLRDKAEQSFYLGLLTTYAAMSTKDFFGGSVESYVFEIISKASSNFGDLDE